MRHVRPLSVRLKAAQQQVKQMEKKVEVQKLKEEIKAASPKRRKSR